MKHDLDAKVASLSARRDELLATPKGAVTTDEVPDVLRRLMIRLQDESLPIEERRTSLGRILLRVVAP